MIMLDANDWFANAKGLARAELRQNDFGLSEHGRVYCSLSDQLLEAIPPVPRMATEIAARNQRAEADCGRECPERGLPLS